MQLASALTMTDGRAATPMPLFKALAYGISAKDNLTSRAATLVTFAHIAALYWLIYQPSPAAQQPLISFTVTLMDVSVSGNSVSSAASAASTPATKDELKKPAEETTTDSRSATLKRIQPATQSPPKTNAPLSHNSQAQTAVLAPITPAQFDAAYLQNPKPTYPALSRRLGEQGNVLLSVFVNEDGRAENVRLQKSSGYERLDHAAIEAVSRWRFAAATQGDRLIASWVNIPIKFVLE